MPFEIVRNDITNMRVDAIVNTANRRPVIGSGTDAGIHQKAGPELLRARMEIGDIAVGQAAITPGFGLHARHVIHVVSPVWQGGVLNEQALLGQCYARALDLAKGAGCESVAFPLLASGNNGFPKPLALQIAVNAFSSFLMENDMQIYLVVFSRDAFQLSEKLFISVASFIDEHYVQERTEDEYLVPYGREEQRELRGEALYRARRRLRRQLRELGERTFPDTAKAPEKRFPDTLDFPAPMENAAAPLPGTATEWESVLTEVGASFSETLLKLIDRTGKTDADIYKKANIDRKLFSKIRNNMDYKPSKATALAFCLALELDLAETRDFIARAGFALSPSSKFDIIVQYFIIHRNYDIFELNEVLFAFKQPLLGA